jgi:DNA mismatch repair protein MSH2
MDSFEGEDKFCNFFARLPKDVTGSLMRFFDRGSEYTVHGKDADIVAREVFQSQAVIKYMGGRAHQLPSVTMSSTVFRKFLQECLTVKGIRVEIYQSEKNKQWICTKQASPGNLQDVESLLGASDLASNPVLMAVKVVVKDNQKTIGACFTGIKPREIGINEFHDNELFSNFESMVIQCGVKECLIQADLKDKDFELRKLKLVLERCGIIATEIAALDFNGKDVQGDLSRLLADGGSAATLTQFEMKVACGAAGALIKYLSLMSDAENFGKWTLSNYDLSQYMKLDASALKALSLMPTSSDAGNKSPSVYGLLNRCQTPLGKRLLAQWLHQPLVDLSAIRTRHDLVGAFVEATGLRDSLQHEHLKLIPDLYKVSKKFQKGIAGLEDVVRLYQVAIRLPWLTDLLRGADLSEATMSQLQTTFTDKLDRFNGLLAKLQDLVETTVDLEALDRHEFLIKPDFDPNLGDLREQIDSIRKQIVQEHVRVGKDLDMDTEKKLKLEDHTVHGYCFRLTRTDASQIRNRREYSELATAKAGVYFTSQKLSGLAREFADCSSQYSRHQTGLVREVVTITASYCPVVEELGTVIAELDVLASFAQVSCHAPTPYVRPTMHAMGTGNTVLKDARHPSIEMQDDVSFICNDVELRRGVSEFLIITGANM